jgi:hypothetical protein
MSLTLKQAIDQKKLDQFADDHKADTPGDEDAFNRALASMAGTSKVVPAACPPDGSDD